MRFGIPRKVTQYIFFEMWPTLVLGLLVFVFILLMFQALRYTEFVLIHGVGVKVIAELMGYLAISFLPGLFPMSLLFSVLMTYGRLSQDSEIVALKASGHEMTSILFPAMLLSVLVALVSAQTSFYIAPWGNRQFEILVSKLGQTKAGATLREGTFSEGFFDLVIYASQIESKTGQMSDVFIFDERDPNSPLTIIAKKGQIIQDQLHIGNSALLRLYDGDIHRKADTHTKIRFKSSDFLLTDPIKEEIRAKSPPSLLIDEIRERLKSEELEPSERTMLVTEMHKRWAIALVCLIFAALGVGLGTTTNRRAQKSGTVMICLGIIIAYWVLYVTAEGMARSGAVSPVLAIWTPNIIFLGLAAFVLRKNWN